MSTIILTEKVKLKPLSYEDASSFFRVIDTERAYFREWLPFVDHLLSQVDVENYINQHLQAPSSKRELIMAIYVEEEFSGLIGFKDSDRANMKTEVGYWLSLRHQKKGIMSMALKWILCYAFNEFGMNRVQLKVATGNISSLKLGLRLGFYLEGIERDGELLPSGFSDVYTLSMLRREFNYKSWAQKLET